MFHIVTRENSHLYADEMDAMFRLRYDYLVGRRGWTLPHRSGRERDELDGADAIYLIKIDPDGTIVGTTRYLPTALARTVVDMVPPETKGLIPCGDGIWEASKGVLREDRRGFPLMVEYCTAVAELASLFGFAQIIYVVDPSFHRTLVSLGWDAHALGDRFELNGETFQASMVHIHRDTLGAIRAAGKTVQPIVTYHRAPWPPLPAAAVRTGIAAVEPERVAV